MSTNEIVLIVLFAAPLALLMLLRANATLVFLSLCLGYVVMQFLGTEARSFADMFMPQASLSTNVMELGLLLFPPVFTTLFMMRTLRGTKLAFNLLPAIATGFLAMLLIVPLLSPGISYAIMGLTLWHQLARAQTLVIGVGALVSLLFLWLQRPHKSGDEHSKHHKD
jgi:hypothetical protein